MMRDFGAAVELRERVARTFLRRSGLAMRTVARAVEYPNLRSRQFPANRFHIARLGARIAAHEELAAKYARVLNEFPRDRSAPGEKKLTTRALEELTEGDVAYRVVPRRRTE